MSWTLIEHQTLSSSVASVTLGSGGTIPQTYKTLKVVISGRSDAAGGDIKIGFNGTTTNLSRRNLYGSGSATGSGNASDGYAGRVDPSTATASTFGSTEITVPNYSGSTNKPFSVDSVDENNGTTAFQVFIAGLWSNTAAITSITISDLGGSFNFVSGSTFTLYGLA